MDNSGKMGVIVFVFFFLAWFIYFFVWNKQEKINWSELTFNFNFSPIAYMMVIIVLLLVFMIRQEVQLHELKEDVSSLRSEQERMIRDIRDVENAVYSTCN